MKSSGIVKIPVEPSKRVLEAFRLWENTPHKGPKNFSNEARDRWGISPKKSRSSCPSRNVTSGNVADPQLTRDIKWYDAYGVNLKGGPRN